MRTDRLAPKMADVPGEVHIAGVLVQARPDKLTGVITAIASLPIAEIQQFAPDGRIVVVLEAPSGREVVRGVDALRDLPGVLNVALVYQHAEPEAALQQEMPS